MPSTFSSIAFSCSHSIYRNYDHLNGSQLRRQYQTVVIGMRHDECAHQTGGYSQEVAQAYSNLLSLLINCIKCLSEVLPQEMRRAALQSFPVLHHGFDGISVQSTGKTFCLRFSRLHYGHGLYCSAKSAYTFNISLARSSASSRVACAVCPSCHKNSAVRRKSRVRIPSASHCTIGCKGWAGRGSFESSFYKYSK